MKARICLKVYISLLSSMAQGDLDSLLQDADSEDDVTPLNLSGDESA